MPRPPHAPKYPHKVCCDVDAPTMEYLSYAAKMQGVPIAELVRRGIARYMEEEDFSPQRMVLLKFGST